MDLEQHWYKEFVLNIYAKICVKHCMDAKFRNQEHSANWGGIDTKNNAQLMKQKQKNTE